LRPAFQPKLWLDTSYYVAQRKYYVFKSCNEEIHYWDQVGTVYAHYWGENLNWKRTLILINEISYQEYLKQHPDHQYFCDLATSPYFGYVITDGKWYKPNSVIKKF
jgi:hypothetical protein